MTDENKQSEDTTKEDTATEKTPEQAPQETSVEHAEQGDASGDTSAEENPASEPEQQQTEADAAPAEEVRATQLQPGMTIRVHQRIKEGEKERIQVFQGMILALRGKTPETKTMTVGKRSFGVYVERIFPLASPLLEKIEVVKQAKVRRAKLYFLKNYTKRLKETFVTQ